MDRTRRSRGRRSVPRLAPSADEGPLAATAFGRARQGASAPLVYARGFGYDTRAMLSRAQEARVREVYGHRERFRRNASLPK
jgi:hypothetical protein